MVNIYRAIILTILLYGLVICTNINIHWNDFINNIKILEMANITRIKAMPQKSQL